MLRAPTSMLFPDISTTITSLTANSSILLITLFRMKKWIIIIHRYVLYKIYLLADDPKEIPVSTFLLFLACECSTMGSLTSVCNQTNGQCFCKENTQGSKCGQCKPGTFSMSVSNPDGCQSCYGFGHSISCRAAQNFSRNVTFSNFTRM